MDRQEALKFVNDWLWASPNRSTDGMPWADEYKADAISEVDGAGELRTAK